MAFVGLLRPVCAQIDQETEGQAIQYKPGMVVGKAIRANVTIDRNDNPLYADDTVAENDNGMTGGTVEFEADDIMENVRVYMLGLQKDEENQDEYELTEDPAPYVGFGYVRVRRKNGNTTYQAVWYHKTQFSETTETAQTKGKSIEWGTPTINGQIMGVRNDASGKTKFRRIANFDTPGQAFDWLDGKAGIASQSENSQSENSQSGGGE